MRENGINSFGNYLRFESKFREFLALPSTHKDLGNHHSEVEDRGPQLDSWYLSSRSKIQALFSPRHPRMKLVTKLISAEGKRWGAHPEVKEDLPVCTCTERPLGGQKMGAPHNNHGHVPTVASVVALAQSSKICLTQIHLTKICTVMLRRV